MRGKTGKPFYKKWWVWILAVIVIGIALSGGEEEGKRVAGDVSDGNPVVSQPVEEESEEVAVIEDEVEVEQPVVTEPEPVLEENDDATLGEKNAAGSAKQYLSFTAFSYEGLVKQLEFEGYSHEEAIYGVDSCGADWSEQAVLSAKNYLDFTAFSYKGLIQQLEFEGFTSEEAVHGADSCGADWKEQAAAKAKDYLDFSSFSRSELIAQLEFEGFTSEEALYGVEAVGY